MRTLRGRGIAVVERGRRGRKGSELEIGRMGRQMIVDNGHDKSADWLPVSYKGEPVFVERKSVHSE